MKKNLHLIGSLMQTSGKQIIRSTMWEIYINHSLSLSHIFTKISISFIDFGKLIFCRVDLCIFFKVGWKYIFVYWYTLIIFYYFKICCWVAFAGDFSCMPKNGNWLQKWLRFILFYFILLWYFCKPFWNDE